MANPRLLLAAGLATAVVVAAAVVLAVGGSGGGESSDEPVPTVHAKLALERAMQSEEGYEELIVSLPDQRLNSPETTGGARSVFLECVDAERRVTVRQRHKWPLVEEYGYPPHIHQPALEKVLNTLRSCRLTGTGVDFRGRVAGRLPPLPPVG